MSGERQSYGFPMARAKREPLVRDRFNPSMFIVAREARGLTQTDLAARLSVGQPLVGKWEAGIASPSDDQRRSAADALGVHPDFFFIDRSRRLASLSDFYHRSLAKAKRSDVKMIHARCCILDLQVDRLLEIGSLPEDLIPDIDPDNHKGDIERVAMMARTVMGMNRGPVENLVDRIEACGGIVIDRALEVDDIDALCRWVPELPKLFYINGSRPADRIRFSLAHELGHTVMHFGRDMEPQLAEAQANTFASALLMPAEDIRGDLRGSLSLEKLAALKRKWRVSMQALITRAFSLGIIDDRRRTSLFVQLSRYGWRKTEPVEIQPESPKHFARLLQAHIDAGYSSGDLSSLLFVAEEDINDLLGDYQAAPTWERDGVRLRLVR